MTTAHLICFLVGVLVGGLAMCVVFVAARSVIHARHQAAIKAVVAKLPK